VAGAFFFILTFGRFVGEFQGLGTFYMLIGEQDGRCWECLVRLSSWDGWI